MVVMTIGLSLTLVALMELMHWVTSGEKHTYMVGPNFREYTKRRLMPGRDMFYITILSLGISASIQVLCH